MSNKIIVHNNKEKSIFNIALLLLHAYILFTNIEIY